MIYLYAARNFSTLVGLASPDPLSQHVRGDLLPGHLGADRHGCRVLDGHEDQSKAAAGPRPASCSLLFYMIAAEQADEKVRRCAAT